MTPIAVAIALELQIHVNPRKRNVFALKVFFDKAGQLILVVRVVGAQNSDVVQTQNRYRINSFHAARNLPAASQFLPQSLLARCAIKKTAAAVNFLAE